MKSYVRVDKGIVMEVIDPLIDDAGTEVPIESRFTPELVAEMIDVTDISPQPQCWWTFDGGAFFPPVSG
ncbi:hypothetical protein SB394_02910 [Burkholderia sp. BCCIQ04A]|uniref:Uncharacterized protein n=1 Tax=Burkholderia anthinoferrum TaxID=3090833 RepID=A0ABU5WU88_9BURK|nr:hypothetical protein [Burkholderia anthinoferrum]MEB2535917.1 hypothetical protein [Burkholderia anthinoferrum]MEB2562045.1 hypothetical protein [Burkholderia anthinoferrum]MEB2582345.1 hypothetical protein [Burkholderia anthinoferrum]MEB2632671.1 hypothetical protein [Burkholderia anthinoferrum]